MRLSLPWRQEGNSPPAIGPRWRQSEEPGRQIQYSKALASIIETLGADSQCSVLDLGAPLPANLGLYAKHGAAITIADLYRSRLASERNGDTPTIEALLPRASKKFDVVVAWDVLNYLSLEEVGDLFTSLASHAAPLASVMAFVSSSGEIPSRPSRYSVIDENSLVREDQARGFLPSPNYSEQTLLRAADVELSSRSQLRNGMIEYLFVFRR